MEQLMRWLGEQFDEDERIARAATPGPWADQSGYVTDVGPDGLPRVQVTDYGTQDGEPEEDNPQGRADSKHIAVWDPARVLSEIDAKQQLLRAHNRPHECIALTGRGERSVVDGQPWELWEPEHTSDHGPCTTLRLLALPYADRPGYREEWRP